MKRLRNVAGGAVFGALLAVHASSVTASVIATPADAKSHGLGDLRTETAAVGGVPKPDLSEYINSGKERELEQLGKLLFFDTAVGSNGMACASCHFHAGADNRTISLASPGLMRVRDQRDGDIVGYHAAQGAPDTSFWPKGPGESISLADFPLVRNPGQLIKDGDLVKPAPGNSNDAMSSPGVIVETFDDVTPMEARDTCTAATDNVFRDANGNTRRVPPRNTPSTINAVFNAFNFWDGRANHYFNGRNPFGVLDQSARVLFNDGTDIVEKNLLEGSLKLENSSLASQAVGPPLSDFEESCEDGGNHPRTWQHIGKKLLRTDLIGNEGMWALSEQVIHPRDSLIGEYSRGSTAGSTIRYRNLIKEVFQEGWWKSDERRILLEDAGIIATERPAAQAPFIAYPDPIIDAATPAELEEEGTVEDAPGDGVERFTLMEANFSLFFGLAIQAYESTLVADDSPFDRWMRGNGSFVSGFGSTQLRGLNVFVNEGKCANCHGGPEFTNASVRNFQRGKNLIEPMAMADNDFALYDNGFYNIGVTPTVEDLGRGGQGPNGTPLASSRQRLADELGLLSFDAGIIGRDHVLAVTEDEPQTAVCNDLDGDGFCSRNEPINPAFQRAAVDGAFKTPGLRNIELTGPYFHNGSVITLAQMVEFYDNGGNFCDFNSRDLDPDITSLGLTTRQKRDLVYFLRSLTDQRVVRKKAPFDHPSIDIPLRGSGDEVISLRAGHRYGVSSSQMLRPTLNANHTSLGAMPTTFHCSTDNDAAGG